MSVFNFNIHLGLWLLLREAMDFEYDDLHGISIY